MLQAKDCHDDIPHVVAILLAANSRQAIARCACSRSEGQRLSYGQLGEMHVCFGSIDGFASKLIVHLLCGDAFLKSQLITPFRTLLVEILLHNSETCLEKFPTLVIHVRICI